MNNPVNNDDPDGKFAQLALAGGVALGGGSSAGAAVLGGLAAIGPVGWVAIGIGAIVITGTVLYAVHRKKNGSKAKTNDTHTNVRSGSQKNKAKQKPGWEYKGNKKDGPTDYTP